MAFSDQQDLDMGKLTTIGLGIAAFIVAGLGLRFAIDHYTTSPSAVERSLVNVTESNPALGSMFTAMKEHYPKDYQAFVTGMSEEARGGASEAEIGITAYNFYRELSLRVKDDFRAAPKEKIFAVRDKNIELVELLKTENTDQCARFTMEGLRPGERKSPEVTELSSLATALLLEAAAAGRDNPAKIGEPTEEDWELLRNAMQAQDINDQELIALSAGDVSGLSMARQCAVGASVYKALARVPDEASWRISANLLIPEV